MSIKPDETVCVFGAIALQRYIDALSTEIEGVRLGKDIECIHRMRVASRRMRSAFDLFKDCLPARQFPIWEKQIRKLTKSLGSARDTDVQIEVLEEFIKENAGPREIPGLRRILLRLRQNRATLQEHVLIGLDHLDADGILQSMQNRLASRLERQAQTYLFSPAIYQLGYERISGSLADFLAYEPYVNLPDQTERLHAMRIAAKRLRYCLEIFSSLYPGDLKEPIQACRKFQDQLGDLHDSDVWIAFLPQFLIDEKRRTQEYFGNLNGYFRLIPGIECFLADRHRVRDASYEDFTRTWEKHQSLETWPKLASQIQIPFFRGEPPQTVKPDSLPQEASSG